MSRDAGVAPIGFVVPDETLNKSILISTLSNQKLIVVMSRV